MFHENLNGGYVSHLFLTEKSDLLCLNSASELGPAAECRVRVSLYSQHCTPCNGRSKSGEMGQLQSCIK